MDDNWRLVRCGERDQPKITKTEIVLDCENVVIGRNVDLKYRLDCPNISRQHACMTFSNGYWDITDLRSHNGVFVNGVKIAPSNPVTVHESDIIGFGKPVAKSEDVFVFKLMKNVRPVIKKEPHDQSADEPKHKPPFQNIIQLSDDDDVVVTAAFCKRKRNIPVTSPQHSSVPEPPPLVNGSVVPALKVERDDCNESSSGLQTFSNEVSSGMVASMSLKAEAIPVSTFQPQRTPVIGGGAEALNRASCEAFETCKNGTGFPASSQAQRVSSVQTPMNVTVSSSSIVAVPSTRGDTQAVEDSTLTRTFEDLPLRAVKREELACNDQPAGEFGTFSPTDLPRPIKQDPEGGTRNGTWSVSNMPAVSHLENGSRNSPDSSGCASLASSKTGMHLKNSTSLHQHKKDFLDSATEATFSGEVQLEESAHAQVHAGEALGAQAVELCAKPVVGESMPSDRMKNTTPKETPALMVVSQAKPQGAFSEASSSTVLGHAMELHVTTREHEAENHRSPVRPEQIICKQISSTVVNEAEHILKKPLSPSLFILVKPCSVVLERLASPEKYISESHNGEEEDSSEDDDDVLLAAGSSDMSFSQEDQIITISSDSEDDAGPVADSNQVDLQIKREPDEIEEIVNDGTDLDDNVLLENQCPSDLPEERSDCVLPPMAEDGELEKRLVWNEPELEEEVTSADERQPENDFFPVLSQSFDDEPAPAKKARSSTILVEPLGRPSSSTHAVSAHSGNRRSPKKKESLRASLIKSMKKHRVPITDFKSRDVPREPSAAEETEDRRQVSHKNRFKSRTAFLLDTHDAKNIAKKKPCSTPTTVNAVHPVSKVGTCNRSSAAVESAKQSAVGEGACAVRACSPPRGTFPVQSEPCSHVPSFKKFVRISRVSKPSPVPVSAGVPPQQNGMPTSSSAVGPRGSPCVERMDVEPTTSWSVGPHGSTRVERMEVEPAPVKRDEDPAAWLPVIPPGSPPTSERMEVDSGKEAAAVSPPRPSRGSPPVESMDVDVEKKRRVWFHVTEPSNRTDQERAEFTERVRASLKKKKLESAGQRSKANLGAFIAFILGWKVPWLKEQQASATPPPLLDMNRFRSKRVMYSSLAEYKLVHFQFLCLEVWQSVFRSWQEYFSLTSRMSFSCAVENDVCPPGDVTILSCVVLVRQEEFEKSLYPVEGHLVRLDLRLKEQKHSAMPVFGFVMQHRFHRDTRVKRAVVPSLLQKSYVDGSVPVELKIQVRARPVMLDFSKTQRLSVVSKITPTLRQMEAVSELEQSMFVQAIVRPNTRHFWCERGHPLRADFEGKFSEEQRQVISSAVAATRAPGNDPRIVILHGPPGTGKTHTIIGMVTELLRSSSRQTMLIVAPSNTAVDEIARRLLAYRAQQAKRATPSDMMLKAVRVGQDNMVHADVRGICLTELLHKNIQREEAELSREADQAIAGLEKELRHWQDKKQQLASSTRPDARALRRAEFQLGDLQLRLQRAKESKGKRRRFRDGGGRQSRSMNERKLAILRGAHVVLSTLNSCRSRLLEEAFGRTSPNSFSCVLVDEATQCTEVEALLCLQYRTSRLILVGDPMQLPATVLSQEAVAHGFQESLFERFYKYLKQEADLKPIFALSEQRRMHSEICHFPSRNFYGGKLRPIAGLDEAYASFPLTPYLVFNIADSPETNEDSGMSWLNRGEAAFVARLCHAIFDIVGVDLSLGIITPYQAQKSAIVEHLFKLLPRGQLTCDVNTVDSFQGQERDVIILSCVRAHNPKGQIGFVADARRLNVAITRAKKALYICGHLDSLKDNKEWAALVCDAKDRGKVQDVSANCSTDLLTDIIRKPHSSVE